MKKIALLFLGASLLTSCYDDYVQDFDYTGVYFAKQINTRTVVVGEGLKVEFGAVLGGVLENKYNRNVNFTFDNALVTQQVLNAMKSGAPYIKSSVEGVEQLQPMPTDYYTLSNPSSIVIPKGDHLGKITIKMDSAKFLADAATLRAQYVLPFKIVSADADSIIPSMSTSVLGLHYENMLFGNYWHGGVTVIKDKSGNTLETLRYETTIPQAESKVYTLTTVAPHSLETNKISNGDIKGNLKLTLQPDGTLLVEKGSKSAITILSSEGSKYNQAKLLQDRRLLLNYQFETPDGNLYHVSDTLQFRNRIRDGVNEWQDENKENYN